MKTLRIVCLLVGFLSLPVCLSAQTFTTLYAFSEWDGWAPAAPLIQATNGNFYGTTVGFISSGFGVGVDSAGTVFGITPDGTLAMYYDFQGNPDGAFPQAGLLQAADGNFYGTTAWGGDNPCWLGSVPAGCGNLFKITPSGTPTTLYSFCSQPNCADGVNPVAALIQAKNGDFYGTTSGRGANYGGTVFRFTARGKLKTLYSFCSQPNCADGGSPQAGLVEAYGAFYGTTYGGANASYCTGSGNDCGTVFKITASGKLTTLYTFCSQGGNCTDGANPTTVLIQGIQGKKRALYGTTFSGGANGWGTVFKITAKGSFTTLYSFCSQSGCLDGASPEGGGHSSHRWQLLWHNERWRG